MESNRIVSLIFSALTAAAVWFLWGTVEGSENATLYAGCVLAAMVVLSLALYGKRFAGPPIGEEIKRRQAEIAVEEARVGERI